jgi:UDP-N-acetylmuramyl pentapeptide phosphotransferase/UDP-N-acetylglucosamine-1-phosphate transferase
VALIVAAAVTLGLTPLAARLAHALGVVDRPGELKVQTRPVAYLGGLAIFAGMVGPVAGTRVSLVFPLGMALILGLADDITNLSARARLAGEVGIGVTAVVVLPGSPTVFGAITVVITVVALLNAINLLDGLDGLASSVGAIAALGFACTLAAPERSVALALGGALIGFLAWNRPPAHIYAGDAGSYLIGTALAVLLCLTVTSSDGLAPAAGALLFVGVPVADTTVAIVRRQRAGRPLFEGDRGHVYDQLVDRGWAPARVTIAAAAAQGLLVAVGLGAGSLAGPQAVAVVGAVIAVVGVTVLWAFTSPTSWVP